MRIYNRAGRSHALYTLRILCHQFTGEDWMALAMGLTTLTLIILMPISR